MSSGSKCKYCNVFIAGSRKKMNKHLVRCEAERPYECDALVGTKKCGRRFTSAKGMGVHQGMYHTGKEKGSRFNCKHCSHGTNNERSFHDHQERCGRGAIVRRLRTSVHVLSVSRGPSMVRGLSGEPRDRSVPRERSDAPRHRSVPRERADVKLPPRQVPRSAPSTPIHRGGAHAADDDDLDDVPPGNRSRESIISAFAAVDYDEDDSSNGSADEDGDLSLTGAPIDKQGMYSLSLLDPDKARLIMYQQHKLYDDVMERMRTRLEQVKEIVRTQLPDLPDLPHNLNFLEEQLDDYFANHSAEALEANGKLNLGIAERAAAAALAPSVSLSASGSSSNWSKREEEDRSRRRAAAEGMEREENEE